MNLLASQTYDPAGAVSKATTALLAMTALDTTNLRLAVVVPAHGKVLFRLSCAIDTLTILPQILLGVMHGATVLGRLVPQAVGFQTSVEFIATGLTPGAMNIDAAYAVQVVVASSAIKYGGPDDASGADAWGGFVFEAWDPAPVVDKVGYKLAADGLDLVTAWTVDLIGTITGDLNGSVLENVDGNLVGNVGGDVQGNLDGNVGGNVTGSVGSVINVSNFIVPPPSTPGVRS